MRPSESHNKLWVTVDDLIQLGARIAKPASKTRKRVHTQLMGNHSSVFRGRGLDFEEVRQYSRGDDVRLIDWKVTARTQKAHTRVYSEEKERPTYIIADQCTDMCFASQGWLKTTQVAELASMIAFTTLKRGDRVGATLICDEEIHHLKPVRSKKHVVHLCSMLAQQSKNVLSNKRLQFQANKLVKALHGLLGLAYHDANIFVLTSKFKLTKECQEKLIRLARNNQVTVCSFTDPLDYKELPVPIPLTDGKLQYLQIPGNNDRESVSLDGLTKMGVGYIELTTTESTFDQAMEWLKQHNTK